MYKVKCTVYIFTNINTRIIYVLFTYTIQFHIYFRSITFCSMNRIWNVTKCFYPQSYIYTNPFEFCLCPHYPNHTYPFFPFFRIENCAFKATKLFSLQFFRMYVLCIPTVCIMYSNLQYNYEFSGIYRIFFVTIILRTILFIRNQRKIIFKQKKNGKIVFSQFNVKLNLLK